MSRVKTEHRVITEGATGRLIARRFLRKSLGNPKKREKDKAALCQELFFKGVASGKKLENLRIQYSTAGMEYGADYSIGGSTDEIMESTLGSSDVLRTDPSGELSLYPPGEGVVDANGGTDFPSV